jgi:hypothetical protein
VELVESYSKVQNQYQRMTAGEQRNLYSLMCCSTTHKLLNTFEIHKFMCKMHASQYFNQSQIASEESLPAAETTSYLMWASFQESSLSG